MQWSRRVQYRLAEMPSIPRVAAQAGCQCNKSYFQGGPVKVAEMSSGSGCGSALSNRRFARDSYHGSPSPQSL